MNRILWQAFAAVLLSAICLASPHGAKAQSDSADWPSYNRTLNSQRYSPLTQINTRNVSTLRQQATFDTGDTTSFQTGPLEINGILYFTTEYDTYAIDAVSGKQLWKHHYSYSPPSLLKVNRGLAYSNGRLFRGALNGHFFALDAASGRLLWDVVIADLKKGETVPAAPIAWKDMVFIGNAGGDSYGVLGRVHGIDAATGHIKWTFYVVPDKEKGTPAVEASWPKNTKWPRAGGATWTSYTLDTVEQTLYIPGGNPAPDFTKGLRKGTNLFTNSVVVVKAATGTYVAHYQLVPEDFHDWDASAAPVVFRSAEGRSMVAAAIKDGYLHGFDRKTGERLYKTPITRIYNASAPLKPEGTRFCPGVQGGVEWNGPAYHPGLNTLFVGAVDWCSTVHAAAEKDVLANAATGQAWSGSGDDKHIFGQFDSVSERGGWLSAVDADYGRVIWRYRAASPMIAGVTATAGGLVFGGEINGDVMAFDAATGEKLWHADTKGPIGGGIITYSVNGKQYVAVASGMWSPIWAVSKSSARILIFALPD